MSIRPVSGGASSGGTTVTPPASGTTAGKVKPADGLAVTSDGTLTVKTGAGLKLDANKNVVIDPAAVDVTQLNKADTLVSGIYQGGLTATSSFATLANAQKGMWWNVAAAVTIGGTAFGIGDQLWCSVNVAGTPTNLNNFVRVPATMAQATTSVAGIVQLAGDLGGTATAPLVKKINSVDMPSAAPASGQYLRASSSSATEWGALPLSLVKVNTYDTVTTSELTLQTRTKYVVVEAVGGGGGGGSANSADANGVCAGSGGGGGGYIKAWALASGLTDRKMSISVGAGGAGGAATSNLVGSAGSSCTVSTNSAVVLTATGGLGGGGSPPATLTTSQGGGGGGSGQTLPSSTTPFTTIIAQRGQSGHDGISLGGSGNKLALAGNGGQSLLGWGGRAGQQTTVGVREGGSVNRNPVYGGGGGGAGVVGVGSAKGGDGAVGLVIVYEYE